MARWTVGLDFPTALAACPKDNDMCHTSLQNQILKRNGETRVGGADSLMMTLDDTYLIIDVTPARAPTRVHWIREDASSCVIMVDFCGFLNCRN